MSLTVTSWGTWLGHSWLWQASVTMSMGIPNPLLCTSLLSAIIWPFPQEGCIGPRYTATPHRYSIISVSTLWICVGSNCICKYKISAIRYPPFSMSGYGHWLNIEEGRSLIQEVDPILPGLRNRMLSYKYKYKCKCKCKNKQINHQTNKQQTNKLDAKRQQDAHVCWFVNSSSWVCSWYCVISSICLLLNLKQEVLMTPAIAAIWC